MTEQCAEVVYSGSRDVVGYKCGRAVKEEGLCGIHLAAKRKRAKNDQERREERGRDSERREQAHRFIERLNQQGIHAQEGWNPIAGKYTGGVTLSAENTEALLQLIEGNPS